ncbi:MAG TPA: glycine/sarcosine/betaine reductase selenoprotein B family protein [Alphaproteobacteria bacterium]|nr:glycine/sarcosine/betaine reductase selenoprotein B family protein [Alphaproteobacteria bacterium]
MARLSDLPEALRPHIEKLPCPSFDTTPWVDGPPLKQRRVALVSTAGLMRRGDRPFRPGASDYRVIAGDTPAAALLLSHISTNFDRSGFEQDVNVMLPLDRLRELEAAGEIGAVADFHYSFMGATDPVQMEDTARHLAGLMKAEGVDACLLLPV